MEDAVLRTVARLDGRPFPTTRGLVARLGQRAGAAQHLGRDGVLRRAGRGHLHRDGPAPRRRPLNAYDPGSFWSGDDLELLQGAKLGPRSRSTCRSPD